MNSAYICFGEEKNMATHLMQRPLIIQDENLGVHQKKNGIGGNSKSTKPATEKGGAGFGSRKALNDITNKSSLHHDVSTKKKNAAKEDFNIAGEKFLHDHSKCIEAKQKAMEPFWDTVLPGHDTVSSIDFSDSQPAKSDSTSLCCYPEPVELPISEFYDWLQPSSQWDCLSSFPVDWDSLPSSPFGWDSEPVEFELKEEIDC